MRTRQRSYRPCAFFFSSCIISRITDAGRESNQVHREGGFLSCLVIPDTASRVLSRPMA